MSPPVPNNALAALERARQAQERHERRIDVQLRIDERPWNPFYAALLDENEEALRKRERRPCVYCAKPTAALSGVCCDHDDLPVLDTR